MKMKIIDLIIQYLENPDKMPYHIRYEAQDRIHDLYFDGMNYYDEEYEDDLYDILSYNWSCLDHFNDYVEIIEQEEDKEALIKEDISKLDDKELVDTLERLEKYVFSNQTDDVKEDWKYILIYILKSKLQK